MDEDYDSLSGTTGSTQDMGNSSEQTPLSGEVVDQNPPSSEGNGRGFFSETEEDRRKHEKAGKRGGQATARNHDTAYYQNIGSKGGNQRAKRGRNNVGKRRLG